ncbi:uncharacterized protein METZ01_LOCUS390889, partial [marine metagenome]
MKKIITISIATVLNLVAFTQTDIENARIQGVGATVGITGIVINGDELGPIRYIQDTTAGIALYDPAILGGIIRGDEISVTGILVDYNGLLEMNPVNAVVTNSSANPSPIPLVVTPNQIG